MSEMSLSASAVARRSGGSEADWAASQTSVSCSLACWLVASLRTVFTFLSLLKASPTSEVLTLPPNPFPDTICLLPLKFTLLPIISLGVLTIRHGWETEDRQEPASVLKVFPWQYGGKLQLRDTP